MTDDSNTNYVPPEELLDHVRDRESFLEFVHAMIEERGRARELERAEPAKYCVDGALGWKNAEIDAFLEAACSYFQPKPLQTPKSAPSWRMFAEFLYCGKIIE